MPEHRTGVPKTFGSLIDEVVLNHGTNNSCSTFGAKGKLLPIESILEGVHLLLDNIGDLTNPALE